MIVLLIFQSMCVVQSIIENHSKVFGMGTKNYRFGGDIRIVIRIHEERDKTVFEMIGFRHSKHL